MVSAALGGGFRKMTGILVHVFNRPCVLFIEGLKYKVFGVGPVCIFNLIPPHPLSWGGRPRHSDFYH